ncbi:hypothetical protein F8M41_009734 [Gigaspora margarita]|uniref:Uncharacterized protein n=1 Tax=Gigaspora margarita TaxID=4874 RepID=A0A8H4A2Y0_GIGMA|nr:hypothetical protein F8M41_009734 [Gigaspora margarita]
MFFEVPEMGAANNMLFKPIEIETTSNMLFILTEINTNEMPFELSQLGSAECETTDTALQISETAREHHNRIARE